MPDYIYLLENRLTPDQQNAVRQLREAAREAGTILFLTGDAVRDLTSGQAVRDLEVSVHGNALKLKKIIEKLGGRVWGEDELSRTLYLCFPGTVRVDVISTHRTEYPKPGKPVFHPTSIQEDLRRRDFTVNAMAISLNEGSFGLLMDPLNGAADIESRTLRLVSNYGFLEQPSLLIRATRYIARLGWELDGKTRTRYDNAKGEGVIESLTALERSKELEQIGHEEEGLKVLRALETEGWMKVLFPAWTAAKADEEKLKALHGLAAELLAQGVHADMSAGQMQLLTARLASKDVAALKKLMLRPGFVEEWNSLDALAAGFAKVLLSKENATPSASFKLFTGYDPEAVLWLGFTSKDQAVQERFNLFLKVWPEARQRIPYLLMQEMRITPELPAYREIVQSVFLELIDGRLTSPEEMRAMLEPHSPPAPPPQVVVKRPRAKRGGETKLKERSYDDEEETEDSLDEEEDLDDIVVDEDEIDLGLHLPKVDMEPDIADEADSEEEEPEPVEAESAAAKHAPNGPARRGQAKKASVTASAPATKSAGAAAKSEPAPANANRRPEPPAKPASAPSVSNVAHERIVAKGEKVKKPEVASGKPTASKASVKAPTDVPVKSIAKAPAKAAGKPLVQGSVKPPVQGSVKPPVPGSVKPPVIGSAKPLVQGSVKPPVPGSVKPPVPGSVKPPVIGSAKPLVQGSVKPPVIGSAKPLVQGSVKPPVQGAVKPPVQAIAKPAVKVAAKAQVVKSAPEKAKPATAVRSKGGKAATAKAQKPGPKKSASKPTKKR